MRILLIGGRGHLGSRARRALARVPGVEVSSAGRSASGNDVRVDISNPSTLAALESVDVVVNVSSSHAAAPDRLAEYCLPRKILLLETSSDRAPVSSRA